MFQFVLEKDMSAYICSSSRRDDVSCALKEGTIKALREDMVDATSQRE